MLGAPGVVTGVVGVTTGMLLSPGTSGSVAAGTEDETAAAGFSPFAEYMGSETSYTGIKSRASTTSHRAYRAAALSFFPSARRKASTSTIRTADDTNHSAILMLLFRLSQNFAQLGQLFAR